MKAPPQILDGQLWEKLNFSLNGQWVSDVVSPEPNENHHSRSKSLL